MSQTQNRKRRKRQNWLTTLGATTAPPAEGAAESVECCIQTADGSVVTHSNVVVGFLLKLIYLVLLCISFLYSSSLPVFQFFFFFFFGLQHILSYLYFLILQFI